MARFTFRLATLLHLRKTTRDEARAELAKAYQAEDILKEQQTTLERDLNTLLAQGRAAAGMGEIHVDRLIDARRYELLLQAQRQQLGTQREAVAEEIERRRGLLVEANRDVRVLESLRDKQRARFDEDQRQREIKTLDEAALMRVHRREVES